MLMVTFAEIIVRPVAERSIIQRVELGLNRTVLVVSLKVQMNTSVAVIHRLSSGQMHRTECGTIQHWHISIAVTENPKAQIS